METKKISLGVNLCIFNAYFALFLIIFLFFCAKFKEILFHYIVL